MKIAVSRIVAFLLSLLSAYQLHTAPEGTGAWPTREFTESPMGWTGGALAETAYGIIGTLQGGPRTEGLLVLHKGRLVYERYARGWDRDTPHPVFSVTKSVISALAGIAIGEGHIRSTEQKVVDFFPDAVIRPGQESKLDMTVGHLLTMASGLPGDSDGWEGLPAWWEAEDSGLAAFEIPQYTEPGARFNYNSGCGVHTLACLISRAVGMNLFEYAQEKLFGPLGMASVTWEAAADGSSYGGFGISMTPRDMARFGYLILHNGRWEGRQIIPEDYLAAAAPPSERHSEFGYLFWTFNKYADFPGTYEANGAFGQYIDIFPGRDLVIVRTGSLGWLFESAARLGIRLGVTSFFPNGVPLEQILGSLGKGDIL